MRRSFAATVILCLIAMTSWASACDLSCSLERSHSVCKLDAAATSSAVTASSDVEMDPNMVMPEMPSDTGLVHLHADSCTHSPCNQTSLLAISKSAIQHPVHALPTICFERPIGSATVAQASWTDPQRHPPELRPFDPLSVTLRI